MNLTASSYAQYRCICKGLNLHLFDESMKKKNLPSRDEHSSILIKTLGACPFSISSRIASFSYCTIKNLIKLVIPVEFSLKKYLLIEFKNELIHTISCFAIQILRISSSIVGFFSPYYALNGWKCAEQLDAYCWRQKLELEEKLIKIQKGNQSRITAFNYGQRRVIPLPIRLFSADLYLGTDRVNQLTPGLNIEDENVSFTTYILNRKIVIDISPSFYHQECIVW